jgi:hypothetical protein
MFSSGFSILSLGEDMKSLQEKVCIWAEDKDKNG